MALPRLALRVGRRIGRYGAKYGFPVSVSGIAGATTGYFVQPEGATKQERRKQALIGGLTLAPFGVLGHHIGRTLHRPFVTDAMNATAKRLKVNLQFRGLRPNATIGKVVVGATTVGGGIVGATARETQGRGNAYKAKSALSGAMLGAASATPLFFRAVGPRMAGHVANVRRVLNKGAATRIISTTLASGKLGAGTAVSVARKKARFAWPMLVPHKTYSIVLPIRGRTA